MCDRCVGCGAELTRDDKGLHRKLVNRSSESFMCKKCLSEHFKMSIDDCDKLIENFKAAGCTLF